MSRYRWVVLALGMSAQAAFAAIFQGLPSIGPALRQEFGLSLPQFGALLGAMTLGATLSLLPWGVLIDRSGERWPLSAGIAICGAALWLGTTGGAGVLASGLFVVGAFGAVANVASGSAVAGWFGPSERGLALGIRQAAVPLGGAIAAVALPPLVAGTSPKHGLVALAVVCGVVAVACAAGVRDAASRPKERGKGPYRDRRLWRLALASSLLVASQVSVIGFLTIFFHDERGFSDVAAGISLAAVQVAGIGVRIGVGRWSDRLALRLAPLSRMALAMGVSWLVAPLLLDSPDALLVPVLVVAGTLSFSWNGLSFTAAAELASAGRSGTAIALQQTALFASAAVAAPAFGALVSTAGWRVAFLCLAAGPFVAWGLLRPLVRGEPGTTVRV
ncbi:MAG: MFS transporter [Actinomycetota bacterium]